MAATASDVRRRAGALFAAMALAWVGTNVTAVASASERMVGNHGSRSEHAAAAQFRHGVETAQAAQKNTTTAVSVSKSSASTKSLKQHSRKPDTRAKASSGGGLVNVPVTSAPKAVVAPPAPVVAPAAKPAPVPAPAPASAPKVVPAVVDAPAPVPAAAATTGTTVAPTPDTTVVAPPVPIVSPEVQSPLPPAPVITTAPSLSIDTSLPAENAAFTSSNSSILMLVGITLIVAAISIFLGLVFRRLSSRKSAANHSEPMISVQDAVAAVTIVPVAVDAEEPVADVTEATPVVEKQVEAHIEPVVSEPVVEPVVSEEISFPVQDESELDYFMDLDEPDLDIVDLEVSPAIDEDDRIWD